MDKNEARLYRERWKAVDAFVLQERRAATDEDRLRDLVRIHRFVDRMGTRLWAATDPSEREVWDRWQRLRQANGRG